MEITADDLVELIRLKYGTNDTTYNPTVVLEQVADGTGWQQRRWIDAAVFQMWPSKRSAFEIKISRPDFLHELQHPEKHQWCKECFHEFWFVAPKDVIQIEELPIGAGWMYPRGKQLCIARHAVLNNDPRLDDVLLAAFMRAAHKQILKVSKISIKDALESSKEYQDALKYKQALDTFFNKRNVINYPLGEASDILDRINQASLDKEIEQDKEQLLGISHRFQRSIIELAELVAVIAHKGLLARDEMGNYIVSRFGGSDEESLKALKELQGRSKYNSNKNYADAVELLLNWNNKV